MIESLLILINQFVTFLYKLVLASVGSDGTDTIECLIKMGENRGATDSF